MFGKLFRLKINYFENLMDSASKRDDSLVRVSKRERYFNFSMIRSIKFTFFFFNLIIVVPSFLNKESGRRNLRREN